MIKINSLIALALALLLALALPSAGLAEDSSFALKLTDSVVITTAGGVVTAQELSGVAAQLSGAFARNGDGQLTLTLIAQDDPVVVVAAGISGELAFLMANGLKNVLTAPVTELNTPQIGDPLDQAQRIVMFTGFISLLDDLQLYQGPEETVQFYDSIGKCPRVYAHLDRADLEKHSLFVEGDVSADFSFFTDGLANARIEGTLYNILSGEVGDDANLNFVVIAKFDDSDRVCTIWIGNDEKEVDAKFSMSPSTEFPGYAEYEATIIADDYDNGTLDKDMRLQLSGRPAQMGDGPFAQKITGTLYILNKMTADIDFLAHITDESELYQLSLKDTTSPNTASFRYGGSIESNGTDTARTGLLTASVGNGSNTYTITVNVDLILSNDIEGKLVDISSMPQLRLDTMTREEANQLNAEAKQFGFASAGRFLSMPSVAAFIASLAR